jgi:hypothetical protein
MWYLGRGDCERDSRKRSYYEHQGYIHPITQLLKTEKEYSITLLMSKKLTAANSITPTVDASKVSPLTLTIKPCTNFTYGPFKTLSVLVQVTLCVHTNESITHIPVEIASF